MGTTNSIGFRSSVYAAVSYIARVYHTVGRKPSLARLTVGKHSKGNLARSMVVTTRGR